MIIKLTQGHGKVVTASGFDPDIGGSIPPAPAKSKRRHMALTELKKIVKAIEKKKNTIAKERDELRALLDDVEGTIDLIDEGVESLAAGVRYIEDGIDSMSETL